MLALTSVIALLFLSRFNRLATDLGSVAPGMDGHVVRLGIGGRKALDFFRCTSPLLQLAASYTLA
jgi:hypothetical protein